MGNGVLVSLCVITYNQETYIGEALESVLAQDYDNLEIIISDDNSSDSTFRIIEDICKSYKGNHSLVLNRNERNLGVVGNLNKALQLSSGKYICLAAGDDVMYPDRISFSVREMTKLNVSSLTLNMRKIDEKSVPLNGYINSSTEDRIEIYNIDNYLKKDYVSCGASRLIDRKLIDVFGFIEDTCPTEDSVFNFRAFLLDGLAFSFRVSGDYRVHNASVSSAHSLLTRIDPALIFRQYNKDLELAYAQKIVNRSAYKKLKKDIESYLVRETAIRKLYRTNGLAGRIITWISLLPSFKIGWGSKKLLFSKLIQFSKLKQSKNGYRK